MVNVVEEKISHSFHDDGGGEGGLQQEILEQALQYMSSFGSYVLLFGVAVAFVNFFLLIIQCVTGLSFYIVFAVTQKPRSVLTLDRIKLELARMIAFSLLLLVAADVLETLLKPGHAFKMDELYKMVLIGSIRTTLAYFLGKETEEILHHIAHNNHDNDGGYGEHSLSPPRHQLIEPEDGKEATKSVSNQSKLIDVQQKNLKNHSQRGKNKRKQKKN